MTRVGIVGGGITGLSLGHYLVARGVDSILFEAASEPGGVIRSTRLDGRLLEHGPQRMRMTPPVAELVDAIGLRAEVVVADESLPLYVYAGGALRRVPFTVRDLVATDLLSWRGKLRIFAEPLTGAGRGDETAAELFSRKFGREAYENLIGPLFGGIYGSDPAAMPARHSLSGLIRIEERTGGLLVPALQRTLSGDRPPAVSFEDGMARLPQVLAERHDGRVRLGTPVRGVRRRGDGYALSTDRDEVAVERVVFTTPANVTADLVEDIAPDAAAALRRLTYNPLAIVHLVSDVRTRGFGYQIRPDEGLSTLGVSWNASIFDRDGVYTAFLGGMRAPHLVDRSDEELGAIAREEFAAVTGADAEVANVTRLERGFPAYDRSWDALDGVSFPDGVHVAANYTARMGVPSRIREARTLAGMLAAD